MVRRGSGVDGGVAIERTARHRVAGAGATDRAALVASGSLELRVRVVLALGLLIAARLVNITVPFFLKAVVDQVSQPSLAAVPLAVLIAYGAARLGATLFGELQDAVFAKVGQRAGRRMALRVYDHLFQLSLAYHLQRRTGELSRAIERGVKSIAFLLQTALFSMAPVLFEFVLVIAILLWRYPLSFAAITFVTVAAYALFTIVTTNWRTRFRREMNERDNEFSGAAVDGLINYEVVKAFANEGYESRRLDRALAAYEKAAVQSETDAGLPQRRPGRDHRRGCQRDHDRGRLARGRRHAQRRRHRAGQRLHPAALPAAQLPGRLLPRAAPVADRP